MIIIKDNISNIVVNLYTVYPNYNHIRSSAFDVIIKLFLFKKNEPHSFKKNTYCVIWIFLPDDLVKLTSSGQPVNIKKSTD